MRGVSPTLSGRPDAGWLFLCLCWLGALLLSPAATAQEVIEQDPFDAQSVAYRTALHYDPTLAAPLEQLVKLYREKNRTAELKAIYEAHLAQYPNDAGAYAVLVRVLRAIGDPQAKSLILQAIQTHPEHPYLNYLYYEHLAEESSPEALQVLSKAIELEQRADRRLEWIDLLLQETAGTDDRELAKKHLEELKQGQEGNLATLEALAEKMHRYGFPELGLETIAEAEALNPAPETHVNLQMLAAKLEAALEKPEVAGERLTKLLEGVAPDYWRRSEIVSLRISLLNSNSAREALLKVAREKYEKDPENVESALDLVELLVVTGLRKEAADVLTKSAELVPHSQVLEQKALEVLDRLGDDERTLAFLEKRLEEFPDRTDLRYRMVQALYLVGDQESAEAEFATVTEGLEGDVLLDRRLELARYLRRMNLAKDAMVMFETVVESAPKRLDLRRELAEVQLALGNRESARQVVADWDDKGTTIEHFLEFVQLMVQQDFLSEAKKALEARVERNPESLDLRLLLTDVLGKFGDQRLGALQLQEARELADTGARYRQWLERGMAFHEEFDSADLFFDSEQQRLLGDGEEWSKEQISRFLVLCEVGEINKQSERVAHLLRSQLQSGELPQELELEVRRLLVQTLDEDPAYSLEVETQLKQLLEDDPAAANDYKLRLALLYHGNERPDLAQPLLAEVKLEQIGDPDLLKDAYPALTDFSMNAQALTVLERLVTLETRNRLHWQRLLNTLVGTGREVEFRQTLWRLISGRNDLDLTEESVAALRKHMADSYWRSISSALQDPDTGPGEVTALLDALERSAGPSDDRLWALWARAYLLNQMGQTEARDQVVQVLLESCRRAEKEAIAFPDGLAIRLSAAEQILKEPPQGAVREPVDASPVNEGLQMAWGFEADPGAVIVDVEPVGDFVLILDHRRTVYGLDRASGKLLWRNQYRKQPGEQSLVSQSPQQVQQFRQGNITVQSGGTVQISGGNIIIGGGYQGSNSMTTRQIMSQLRSAGHTSYSMDYYAPETLRPLRLEGDGSRRFYVPDGDALNCYDAATGKVIWSSPILANLDLEVRETYGAAMPLLEYEVVGDRILCFDPNSSVAASIETETGKILWLKRIPQKESDNGGGREIRAALNSGAAFGPERMMVYGARAVVLDSRTGEILWEFDADTPRRFPLELNSKEEESALGNISAAAMQRMPVNYVSHTASTGERSSHVNSFLSYEAALVAPAAEWALQRNQDGQSRLAVLQGRKLLLMGPVGVGVYSLDLPLAGQFFHGPGTYLGGSGNRAAYRTSTSIELLDFKTGQSDTILLDAEPGERIEAFVQGHRVYACGNDGIRCWNLHTGRRIYDVPWPSNFAVYAQKHGGFQSVQSSQYYWQGIAHSSQSGNTTARVCYPVRTQSDDGSLLVMVSDGVIASLKPREVKEEG